MSQPNALHLRRGRRAHGRWKTYADGHTAAPRWRCAPQALQALAAGSQYVFSFLFEPPVHILRRLPAELTRVLRADAEQRCLKRRVRIAVCEPDVLLQVLVDLPDAPGVS